MVCKDFENSIIFYIDDELKTNERKEFEVHLKNCSLCKLLFEKVNSTYSLAVKEDIEINPFFYTRVMAKMEANSNKKKSILSKAFVPKLQLASFAFACLFAIFLGHSIASDNLTTEPTVTVSELSDEELFADMHYLSLNTNNVYVIDNTDLE